MNHLALENLIFTFFTEISQLIPISGAPHRFLIEKAVERPMI